MGQLLGSTVGQHSYISSSISEYWILFKGLYPKEHAISHINNLGLTEVQHILMRVHVWSMLYYKALPSFYLTRWK